jgi:ketosteroid isomerase-like protein
VSDIGNTTAQSATAQNKELVLDFWAAAQPDKIPFLADDAVWHLPTSVARRGFPAQDLRGEQVHTLFLGSAEVYQPERTWDIDHLVAEDDLVTLHCTMHARTTAGNDYHGSYHMLFRLADGKIAEAWEFLDTAYVFECMVPPTGD